MFKEEEIKQFDISIIDFGEYYQEGGKLKYIETNFQNPQYKQLVSEGNQSSSCQKFELVYKELNQKAQEIDFIEKQQIFKIKDLIQQYQNLIVENEVILNQVNNQKEVGFINICQELIKIWEIYSANIQIRKIFQQLMQLKNKERQTLQKQCRQFHKQLMLYVCWSKNKELKIRRISESYYEQKKEILEAKFIEMKEELEFFKIISLDKKILFNSYKLLNKKNQEYFKFLESNKNNRQKILQQQDQLNNLNEIVKMNIQINLPSNLSKEVEYQKIIYQKIQKQFISFIPIDYDQTIFMPLENSLDSYMWFIDLKKVNQDQKVVALKLKYKRGNYSDFLGIADIHFLQNNLYKFDCENDIFRCGQYLDGDLRGIQTLLHGEKPIQLDDLVNYQNNKYPDPYHYFHLIYDSPKQLFHIIYHNQENPAKCTWDVSSLINNSKKPYFFIQSYSNNTQWTFLN